MRYTLRSDVGTAGVIVRVPYPEASSYDVLVDNLLIDPQPWDTAINEQKLLDLKTAKCGDNRYVGVKNHLDFFVTPGCTV